MFKNPGSDAIPAISAKLHIIWKLSKSLTDINSESTLPALTHTKLYGTNPKKAVVAKVLIGTPSKGEVMLINQLGEIGTSLKDSKKYGSLSLLLST